MSSILQKITSLELTVGSIEQDNITSVTDLNCNTLNAAGNITIGGIISAPNQISFRACRTGSNIAVNTNTKLPFNATLHNFGGCYDTSTFEFTVPITGTYFFYISIFRNYAANFNGTILVQLRKNGVFHEQLENGGVQKHFANMVIACDVGDVVTVERRVGNLILNDDLGTAFAGFLIG